MDSGFTGPRDRTPPPVYGAAPSTGEDDPGPGGPIVLEPVDVPGIPLDPLPPLPGLPDPGEEYPDEPGGDNGDSGGGGGPDPVACPVLLTAKPSGCGDPIPLPAGATYGEQGFQVGSGLQRALVFARTDHVFPGTYPAVRESVLAALSTYTTAFARLTVPVSDANRQLIESIQAACDLESALIDGAIASPFFGPRPYASEVQCAQVVKLLTDEAGMPFTPWLVQWLDRQNGLEITDFVPQTILNLFSPDNSLLDKENIVMKDAKCANWWKEVQDRGCGQ